MEEERHAAAELVRLEHACGCAEGAALGFGLLLLYAGWLAFAGLERLGIWFAAVTGFVVFAVGVASGKYLGRRRARRLRLRLLEQVGAAASDERQPVEARLTLEHG